MQPMRIEGLRKAYGSTSVFNNASLQLAPGEFVALVGESGVGKSTLLNCIAGLDDADAGHVWLDVGTGPAVDVTTLTDDERALLRRKHFGFVFQAFHVLPHLNVAQNVELPQRLLGKLDADRLASLLEAVGLEGLHSRMPAQLSGGQLQRVAIARALVHRPSFVLADEPTGNLDPETAERVLAVLAAQSREHRTACLLVTHSRAAASRADRVLRLTSNGIEPAMSSASLALLSWREGLAHPWRYAVIVLALALGVALAWSVHLINASALAEFSAAVRATQGEPDAVLRGPRGNDAGLVEAWLDTIAGDPAVTHAAGVIEIDTYARAATGPSSKDRPEAGQRLAIRVVGVDALAMGACGTRVGAPRQ